MLRFVHFTALKTAFMHISIAALLSEAAGQRGYAAIDCVILVMKGGPVQF